MKIQTYYELHLQNHFCLLELDEHERVGFPVMHRPRYELQLKLHQ